VNKQPKIGGEGGGKRRSEKRIKAGELFQGQGNGKIKEKIDFPEIRRRNEKLESRSYDHHHYVAGRRPHGDKRSGLRSKPGYGKMGRRAACSAGGDEDLQAFDLILGRLL
jgi:hypothetical protein